MRYVLAIVVIIYVAWVIVSIQRDENIKKYGSLYQIEIKFSGQNKLDTVWASGHRTGLFSDKKLITYDMLRNETVFNEVVTFNVLR